MPEKNDTHVAHPHITMTVGDHIAMAESDHVAMTGGDVSLGNHCSDSQSQVQNQHSGHALMMDCDVQCAAMSCISSGHFAQALNYHWPVTTHLLLGHQYSLQLQSSSETPYRPPITA